MKPREPARPSTRRRIAGDLPAISRHFLPVRLRGIHVLRARIARMKRGETIMRRVHRILGALRADRRGSVASFLGISIIPIVAAVGLSVDAGRGWLVKSRLSSAIDAAGLAGGRVITS